MQIKVSEIDDLNPPADAAEFMRQAGGEGHTLWAGWDSTRGGARLFGLRIDGPGWDIVATWSAPREGDPYLSSLLIHQAATGKWDYASITEAREYISAQA